MIRNHLITPFRLFKLFSDAHTVKAAIEIGDSTVLLIDDEGHVHELRYHGRLIDQPPHDGDGDAD